MLTTPAVLTESGDIRLHNREGCRIPIFFTDDTGADRNMTNVVVALVMPGGFRKLFVAGVASNERVLIFAPLELQAYLGKTTEFAVQDESVAEKPVIWTGKLIVVGF